MAAESVGEGDCVGATVSSRSASANSAASTTAAAIESDQTLTVVRSMSRMRSTARIRATALVGSPTAFRTTTIMTIPACGIPAAPILASKAVNATRPCCAIVRSIP